jgi:hypothetical protein
MPPLDRSRGALCSKSSWGHFWAHLAAQIRAAKSAKFSAGILSQRNFALACQGLLFREQDFTDIN